MAGALQLKMSLTQAQGDVSSTPPQGFNQATPYYEINCADLAQSTTYTTDACDLGVGGRLKIAVTTANGASYGSVTPVVQTSDDGTNWRAAYVADSQCSTYAAAITGTMGAIASDTTVTRNTIVSRYVRVQLTISGATADITIVGHMRI